MLNIILHCVRELALLLAAFCVLAGSIKCPLRAEEVFIEKGPLSSNSPSAEEEAVCRELVRMHTLIILLDPQDADAYLERGAAKLKLGQYNSAVRDLDEAIRRKPREASAYHYRAYAKWLASTHLGAGIHAANDYARALELGKKGAVGVQKPAFFFYFLRAESKQNEHDFEGALSDLSKSILANAENPRAFEHRAAIRLKMGDKMGAISDYSIAAQIAPELSSVFAGRAAAKCAVRDFVGALADYNWSIKLNSEDADVRYDRGVLREKIGDIQGAIEDYTVPIERPWREGRAYLRRSHARLLEEDYIGAEADAEAAVQVAPADAKAYLALGNAKAGSGSLEAALAAYKRALELEPSFSEVYLARGLVNYHAPRLEAALADISRAIALNPQVHAGLKWQSLINEKLGKIEAAAEGARRAIALEPNDGDGYLERAQIELRLRNLVGAKEDCETAISRGPSFLKSRFYLYMLCTARGEMQAAREIRQDLKEFLGGVDSGGWDLQVGRYLSGSITHDELLSAAYSSNALRMKHKLCTAHCLAGGLALEGGQKQAAADSFEKAIAAKIDDSFAFDVASQVLETMGNQSPR